jgi:hypothetical protein
MPDFPRNFNFNWFISFYPFPPLDLVDKLNIIPLGRGDKIVIMRDFIQPNCGLK